MRVQTEMNEVFPSIAGHLFRLRKTKKECRKPSIKPY